MLVSKITEKIDEFVKVNKILEDNNKLKNTLCFTGDHGIGKTSVIYDYCKNKNIGFEKISLSNLDDLGELSGLPCTEYEMIFEDTSYWITSKVIDEFIKMGYKPTGESRTGYCEPAWVSRLRDYEISILLLDDFSRCQNRFMNAAMDIINHGHYMGWELPKGCTVVLSANPEDKDYQVSYLDDAQKTRFFNFNVEFDLEYYLDFLRNENFPEAFIDFTISNATEIFSYKAGDRKNGLLSTPRQWTKLFSSLYDLREYTSKSATNRILENASAILDSSLASQFLTVLQTDIINIPSIEDIFKTKDYKKEIVKIIGEFGTSSYRIDKANIICSRSIKFMVDNIDNRYDDCIGLLEYFRDSKIVSEDKVYNMHHKLYKSPNFIKTITTVGKDIDNILQIILKNE